MRGPAFFLLPALILYVVFVIVPLCGTVALSFTHWRGFDFRTLRYIGLSNYGKLVSDPVFWKSLFNTFVFTGVSVTLQVTVALVVALFLEQNIFLGKFFRGGYLMPAAISLVIIAIVFDLLLSPALGILKELFKPVGLQRLARFGMWFSDPKKAIWGLSLIQVWYGFGFSMFIFISGLKSIDPQLFDAAQVDGASGLQKIVYITLPLLKGTASVAFLLATMWGLSVYALPYVMTRGGPGHATEVLSTWAYYSGFQYQQMGYGSTIAIALLLLGLTVSFLIFKFSAIGKIE